MKKIVSFMIVGIVTLSCSNIILGEVLLDENFSADLSEWVVLDTPSAGGTVNVAITGSGSLQVDYTNNAQWRYQGVQSKERYSLDSGGVLVVDFYGTNQMGALLNSSHGHPYWTVSNYDSSSDGYLKTYATHHFSVKGCDAYNGDWVQWDGTSGGIPGGYASIGSLTNGTFKHVIFVISVSFIKVYIEDDYYENLSSPTALYTVATSDVFSSEDLEQGLYVCVVGGRYTDWFTGQTGELFDGVKVTFLLSRGDRILLEKGLQIQGLCSPQMWDGNYPPVPPVQAPDMARFLESNFTGMSLLGNAYPEMYFGDMPGMQWGRWANLSRTLRTEELPYLPTMVGFEYNDESDITDPGVLEDANDWFTDNRANYPNVISFANQYGSQNTLEELQDFVAYCKPDMVCFDAYSFEGPYFSTYSAPWYYGNLGIYRTLGLGGHDGTGAEPIPYGMYLQTYPRSGHTPSESEMRLNMFSALTFGYKFMQAFVYTNGWPVDELQSILFTGIDDQYPTAKFYEMAEINREARNLGTTLVRLLSTDLGVIKGIHAIDGGTEENNVPVKVWDANDPNNDPYITSINATYVEHPTVRGDVFVGYFKPLVESDDGPDYENEIYFMVFNGQCDPTEDSNQTRQNIRIDFDFGNSGITSLLRLNRDTGIVETVSLISDGGSQYHIDLTLPGGTADLFKFNTGAFFVRKTIALDETFSTNLDTWTVLDTNSAGGTVDVSVSDGNMTVSLTNNDRWRNQGVQSRERFFLPPGGKLVVDSYGINTGGNDSHCYPYVSVDAHASTDGYWNGSLTSWAAVKGWDTYYGDWAQTSLGGYTDLAGADATTLKHTIIVIDESNVKMYIEDDYYENLSNPTALYTTATSNIFTSDELADGLYVSLTAARYTSWYTGLCKEIFNGVKVQYLYPPTQATSPSPANSATGVSTTADLSWTAGVDATSHNVYFGTSNPPPYIGNQTGTTYDPGTMTGSTTYYWRIDEVGDGGITTGTVCSFDTTTPRFIATGAITSGTGTITPALPAGIATNDILLLFLETSNQAISISNQNGGTWTEVTNSPQYCGTAAGTTSARLTVFWSRYNGTQGAPTTSDSGNHQFGRIIGIRGATTSGNPWDVTAGGTEAASDTSASIPGTTTTVANTLVVVAIATALPDSTSTTNFSAWTNANLTSITERIDNAQSAGNGGALGIATGIRTATGAYGNTTNTLATSAYKGMMSIAIKP